MTNVTPYIRTGLNTLLYNAVSYEGAYVPVFVGGGQDLPLQIIIREPSITSSNTVHNFGSTVSQLIEVVSEQRDDAYSRVDAVGNIIMDLLTPTPRSTGLTIDDSLQLIGLRLQSQSYLPEVSDSGTKVIRLLLRYTFLINEY